MIRLLYEDIAAVQKYYPNIPDNIFMQLISLDPTYRDGSNSLGKYGKWILNLFNRGKITDNDFDEIPNLLKQFTIYKNRIQNKDLNSYKTLDDLADILAQVVDDDSMLTPNQKNKFLKKVKSGKIKLNASDDYDIVLDTPNFIVYVPNTHEASMKLGNGTEWCTAHENPEWYNKYTQNGHKLYIINDKKTGERWQYSDKNGDFLDQNDNEFNIPKLMHQDKKLSKFFENFLGVDYYNFDGTWIYDGKPIPDNLKNYVENIVIPNSVTSIGDSAFVGCSSLTSVTIPNSVTIISKSAFRGCYSLTNITIPNSVKSIGYEAFEYCSSLTSITIPNSVKSIGYEAFKDCFSLIRITIPNGVEYIGLNAFYGCSSLKSITIPNSVRDIGDNAFESCSSLKSITIPNSVTSIGYEAFDNCTSLKSITIPNSVTSIGDNAFWGCSNLTSITIPNSVTSIGGWAFYLCPSLTVYTDNDYAIDYCEENDVSVAPLSEKPKNESYRKLNKLKLRIRE